MRVQQELAVAYVMKLPFHRPLAPMCRDVAHLMAVPLLEALKIQREIFFPGSMRMLMDGRVVALPEEEHRAMRAAAAAKRAQQKAALEAPQRAIQGTPRARRFLQVLIPIHLCVVLSKTSSCMK